MLLSAKTMLCQNSEKRGQYINQNTATLAGSNNNRICILNLQSSVITNYCNNSVVTLTVNKLTIFNTGTISIQNARCVCKRHGYCKFR